MKSSRANEMKRSYRSSAFIGVVVLVGLFTTVTVKVAAAVVKTKLLVGIKPAAITFSGHSERESIT